MVSYRKWCGNSTALGPNSFRDQNFENPARHRTSKTDFPSQNHYHASMKFFLSLAGTLLVLLLIMILLMALAVGQSRRQLEAYAADLENRGEILDISLLAPPPPPEENNGGKEFLAVAKELSDMASAQNRRHFQITEEITPGWNTVVHKEEKAVVAKTPTAWSEVRASFSSFPPLLARIRDLSTSSAFELQPDYAAGFAMSFTGLNESIRSGQLLSQEGILFLQQNRMPEAVENVLAILRLAEMNRKQSPLISQLVSASLLSMAHSLTWELLQSPLIDEKNLTELQRGWNQVRLADSIVSAWRMERCMALSFFEDPRWSMFTSFHSLTPRPHGAALWLPKTWDEFTATITFAIWSTFYRYADARQYLENYQSLIDAAPPAPATGPWMPTITSSEAIQNRLNGAGIERLFSRMVIPSLESIFTRLVATQAMITMTQTAIALQRHRLARGQYPDSLAALVPTRLPAIPRDPFDAEPLRYQAFSNDTYLLYSIGPNGKDEQGDSTKTGGSRRQGWLFGNDLAWPRVGPGP